MSRIARAIKPTAVRKIVLEFDTLPTLKQARARLVEQALIETGGNKSKASRMLGIGVRALRVYIKQHGLTRFSGLQPKPQEAQDSLQAETDLGDPGQDAPPGGFHDDGDTE